MKNHKIAPDLSNDTIKAQVLIKLKELRKPMRNKDVVRYIFKLQGKEDYLTREGSAGYYSTNFYEWEKEGLINRSSLGYSITRDGKLFLSDRRLWQIKVMRDEIKKLKFINKDLWRRSSDVVHIQKTKLNNFVSKVADACNRSGILYMDMVWQEELLDFQENVTNALYESYRVGLFAKAELMKFDHVFQEEKWK